MTIEEIKISTARILWRSLRLPQNTSFETTKGLIEQGDLAAWRRRPARFFKLNTCPGSGVGARLSWNQDAGCILSKVSGIASIAVPVSERDFDLVEIALDELLGQ